MSIAAYDVSGRQVSTTTLGTLGPGRHWVHFDARYAAGLRMTSGVYFLRLRGAAGGSPAVRVLLIR